MFQSVNIKVDKWATENVVSWVKGLDSSISAYHPNFESHEISGKRLLILDHHDLEVMGVTKVGHQEAILESLELLLSFHNDLNSCNLQSLALVVTCRISYLHRILEQPELEQDAGYNKRLIDAVCFLIRSLKKMMNWLNSRPFTTIEEFVTLHHHLGRATLSVISVFSKSSRIQSITQNKSYILDKLAEIESKCDDLVKNGSDPIILTPASLENVTVRKRAEEPLGLHLQSTQQGIHTIKLIRENTACEHVSKLEPGDQIIQVNEQVVIGWQLANVVNALKESPKQVSLTLRKSPRHFSLQSINQQRRPSPKNALTLGEDLKQSTLPKRMSKHGADEAPFDGMIKACSIGDAPADGAATPTGVADDVFSLPPAADVKDLTQSSAAHENETPVSSAGAAGGRSIKPTILVNDVWDPQHSSAADMSSVIPIGKKEILSSFHAIKTRPENRAADPEESGGDSTLDNQ